MLFAPLICILECFESHFKLIGLPQDIEIDDFLDVDDFTAGADGDVGSLDVIAEATTDGIVLDIRFPPYLRWL